MQFSFLVQLASALSIAAQGNFSSKSRLVESAKEHFNYLYLCGDYHLGPKTLATVFPVVNLVFMYDRLGGMCPREFLDEHTDENGRFIYPQEEGFLLNATGAPIKRNIILPVGTLVDRFGGEVNACLSPAFAPYIQRAIPPINLNPPCTPITPPAGRTLFTNNYNLYNVTRKIEVIAGPIAPAFGQPGRGTQYKTSEDVATLVDEGFLQRLYPEDLVGRITMYL
ncbi:hypothetical protein EXIGLDRAFT_673159 [Exidia glandulosa HHB12029]|uniref:TNT domain-containing protein n=1 Tax=Exidia glandulosa HHB12029 TaxID=1314781 RepID=A0A165J3F0_EXIGL|nr:hypothetical protein EXIGLDRAFT_673159 [Exidia glandulosa HHB12029]